ncbi:hypothetical protein R6Q59_033927 [Mikania micrantha]
MPGLMSCRPEFGPSQPFKDLIVNDGGDATLLIHEGVKAEEDFEKTGKLLDPASTDNAEFQIVLSIIKEGLQIDPKKYHKMKKRLVGVSEETTTDSNFSVDWKAHVRFD